MDYLISRFNSFALGNEGVTEDNISSQIRKDFKYVPNSENIVVCLPGWGGTLNKWRILERLSLKQNTSFLSYEFPRGIFSDNKDLTKQLFGIVNAIVRNEITELKKKHNFKKCTLVCISLASSYGSLVYKDNPDINEIILVAPGENLAHDMWHGCRTQHFRRSYERQGITEAQLIQDWRDLASKNNFPAPGTQVDMLFGNKDIVIPYKFSRTLVDIYKQKNLSTKERTFPLGHYFLISLFLLFPDYFLKLN